MEITEEELAEYKLLKANQVELAKLGMAFEMVPPTKLKFYEKNNKRHGAKDLAAINASMDIAGFKEVLKVESDYTVIAGQGTDMVAISRGMPLVPIVRCFDLDKTQAKILRIAHNQTSRLSKFNDDVMVEELQDIKYEIKDKQYSEFSFETLTPLKLDKWTDQIEVPEFSLDEYEPPKPDELTKDDVPDTIFATDNDWDVPVLNLKMMATMPPAPFMQWGDVARANVFRGTWHFYTWDEKFDVLWRDPTGPLKSKAGSIVEPNFSTGPQFPRGMAMGMIYRKRWLARFWQECGLKIVCDINVDARLLEPMPGAPRGIGVLGIPSGWKAWATRGMPNYGHALYDQYNKAVEVAGTDDILYLVYAGDQEIKDICKKEKWTWLEDRTSFDRAAWTKKMEAEMKSDKVLGGATL